MASRAAFVAVAGMLAANLPWLVLQSQLTGLHSAWSWNGEQKCKLKSAGMTCGAGGTNEVAAGASCTPACASGTPSATAAIACPASTCPMSGTAMSATCNTNDPWWAICPPGASKSCGGNTKEIGATVTCTGGATAAPTTAAPTTAAPTTGAATTGAATTGAATTGAATTGSTSSGAFHTSLGSAATLLAASVAGFSGLAL